MSQQNCPRCLTQEFDDCILCGICENCCDCENCELCGIYKEIHELVAHKMSLYCENCISAVIPECPNCLSIGYENELCKACKLCCDCCDCKDCQFCDFIIEIDDVIEHEGFIYCKECYNEELENPVSDKPLEVAKEERKPDCAKCNGDRLNCDFCDACRSCFECCKCVECKYCDCFGDKEEMIIVENIIYCKECFQERLPK